MDKTEVRRLFESEWDAWTSVLDAVDPPRTRVPGVAGDWTAHDVAGHVHMYHRFALSQARAALFADGPHEQDWYGERQIPPDDGTEPTTDERNERLRVVNLPLTWDRLLQESRELRDEVLAFVDGLPQDELDAPIGWVPPGDAAYPTGAPYRVVRRASEVPAAKASAVPVWQYVTGGGHMGLHLAQIREWTRGN